jgi:hypothetical protein
MIDPIIKVPKELNIIYIIDRVKLNKNDIYSLLMNGREKTILTY